MSEIGNSNSYGSVDKLVLQLAASYLTGGELALFQRTITALTESKNVSAIQAFDRNARGSISSNDAAFQVGVALCVSLILLSCVGVSSYLLSNSGGNAMFKIGTYQYNSSDEITSVLFFKFGSSKVLFFAGTYSVSPVNCTRLAYTMQ